MLMAELVGPWDRDEGVVARDGGEGGVKRVTWGGHWCSRKGVRGGGGLGWCDWVTGGFVRPAWWVEMVVGVAETVVLLARLFGQG